MAKKWIRLLCDHVQDRRLLPAGTDAEWATPEADCMIEAGNAVELAEPPQRPAFVARPTEAPEAAAVNPAAEQAVQPAARPRGRPPKAPVPVTVPAEDDDEPAVNE